MGEEAVELSLEAENGTDQRLLDEAADLLYHMFSAALFSKSHIQQRDRNLKITPYGIKSKRMRCGKFQTR
ncbi:MAG TPA: hypothetical protein PK990_08230 [Salinivirgaceae bacterium]|nr:hypothetical protein [Salinivirgaceae bacterium]